MSARGTCGHAMYEFGCDACNHEIALQNAKSNVLRLIGYETTPERVMQLCQAYEALCTGAAMVRPTY